MFEMERLTRYGWFWFAARHLVYQTFCSLGVASFCYSCEFVTDTKTGITHLWQESVATYEQSGRVALLLQ